MSDFELKSPRVLIRPKPGEPMEQEGITNPAAIRSADGSLFLFPRLVGPGNYSRVGIVKVIFDASGEPTGVQRSGVALEPTEPYEFVTPGIGGCEDPRVSYMEMYKHYAMAYTALGPNGPRIALALSEDLLHWRRLGLATFEPFHGVEFAGVDNKDSCLLPAMVPDVSGHPAVAILHRPLFDGTRPEEKAALGDSGIPDPLRESIWMSFLDVDHVNSDTYQLRRFTSHYRLAEPEADWEQLKIGVGPPPILCRHGWLLVYHGVSEIAETIKEPKHLCYAAGLMILDRDDPKKILYRSPKPILTPDAIEDKRAGGTRVVFPTGIDRRDDIGKPDRFDVYFGMGDFLVGVASLEVPEALPNGT